MREEGPREDGPRPRGREGGQAPDEIGPVPVVPEAGAAFQAPGHPVVQDARGIEPGAAGQGGG